MTKRKVKSNGKQYDYVEIGVWEEEFEILEQMVEAWDNGWFKNQQLKPELAVAEEQAA